MTADPELRSHQEWLGMVQPVGLVASARALAAAGAFIDRAGLITLQQKFEALTEQKRDEDPTLPDLAAFRLQVLGWELSDLAGAPGGPELPDSLTVSLQEYGDHLSPTYAVPDPDRPDEWLMLIKTVEAHTGLDSASHSGEGQWHASPQLRFERLLRETGVPIGLLCNAAEIRVVYAPRAESSGHLLFPVKAMCEVGGRPILGALHMLLCAQRLFSVALEQRLPSILRESRKFQNDVSTALAEQVLEALNLLLRGFQAAHEASGGELLREVLRQDPSHVYGALLSVLLRLVFILYAEERGLLPADGVFESNYSLISLFEELREDAARYPDTMDQRFGAWARLLTLFRLIFDGASYGATKLPARHGDLFDPDKYPFLEGRPYASRRVVGEPLSVPRVSDGVVYGVLEKLLILDGERLSYRTLDVEQIGSVYEAMMGFELRAATGVSAALRPDHVVVNLEAVLAKAPGERARMLKDEAKCEVTGAALEQLKAAKSIDDLLKALEKRLSTRVKGTIPAGSMYLQPTEERRRTGSHYTPRSLTEPIVRTTLRPILEALGDRPRPEQILDLKVCDPAMGSGAFLVEACRLLGDRLVDAWQTHRVKLQIPPDEDLHLYARRLVAQTCVYGVDKNPFAVDLAKLSLWLATLAKAHPFTFLDHALREGDSLVGLSREQIVCFHWAPERQLPTIRQQLDSALAEAEALRHRIQQMAISDETDEKASLLREADEVVANLRLIGDLVIAAFFGGEKKADGEKLRTLYASKVRTWLADAIDEKKTEAGIPAKERSELAGIAAALADAKRVHPFHWEMEFPEVFSRDNSGFDAFVGNPPFGGKNSIIGSNRGGYLPYLLEIHEESHGNSDLVAHFFRRAFNLLRQNGAFGLIATNTIAQGDTRSTGLRWICVHGGTIYAAQRRYKWPSGASVIVSVIHMMKGSFAKRKLLDGKPVEKVTAFLFHTGGDVDPGPLLANDGKSFIGSYVLGMGFTFDDTNPEARPMAEMERLIATNPRNRERIFPYIGGDEVNDSPNHRHHRYVINFAQMNLEEASKWPDLLSIVEAKVRPERTKLSGNADAIRRSRFWWQWGRYTPALFDTAQGLGRILTVARHTECCGFAFVPTGMVYSEALVIITLPHYSAFAILQSRPHELWARFFGSSLGGTLRYSPSDCFATFPFPERWEQGAMLETPGNDYYKFRAALMVRNNEGLTKTYNRFNNPNEPHPDILRLRQLHAALDRAVLDSYGWTDLKPTCEFILDYEEEENDDGKVHKKKKPWRYRWPDDFRDEVLARLLALNEERASQEKLAGPKRPTAGKRKVRNAQHAATPSETLFK
jgi:hypothetical protein